MKSANTVKSRLHVKIGNQTEGVIPGYSEKNWLESIDAA